MKSVVVNTFHSPDCCALDYTDIMSFDSHMDVWLGLADCQALLKEMTPNQRAVVCRSSVHLLQMKRWSATVHLVTSWRAFYSTLALKLPICDSFDDLRELAGSDMSNLKMFRIEVETCPPSAISNLIKKIPIGSPVDVDMDYLQTYQKYCFTNAPGFMNPEQIKKRFGLTGDQVKKLGKTETVLECISRVQPKTVYVSELTEEGIEKAKADFFPLLEKLGYKIQFNNVIPDAVAKPLLDKYIACWGDTPMQNYSLSDRPTAQTQEIIRRFLGAENDD